MSEGRIFPVPRRRRWFFGRSPHSLPVKEGHLLSSLAEMLPSTGEPRPPEQGRKPHAVSNPLPENQLDSRSEKSHPFEDAAATKGYDINTDSLDPAEASARYVAKYFWIRRK
ncbi:MAG: hypothetical protein M1299_10240, partial [Firmicutes bacterium]|nr:hypothetical protein [Bacillota bacterium]